MSKNDHQVCSFCHRSVASPKPLFRGLDRRLSMCGECLSFAEQLLREASHRSPSGACSFCRKAPSSPQYLVYGPGVSICRECISLARHDLDGGSAALSPARGSVWRAWLAHVRARIRGNRVERVTSMHV